MEFALTGFTPAVGFRVFSFDGITGGVRQSGFSVKTDLSLARKYGISLQDLPVLCKGLLDKFGEENRALTFTEDQMSTHAKQCEAQREAARNKRSMRRTTPIRSSSRPPSLDFQTNSGNLAAAATSSD